MYALKDPDRLVVDCRPAMLSFPISGVLKEDHPLVKRIRANQLQQGVVLIVFELKQKAKYSALMSGDSLMVRIKSPLSVLNASKPQPQPEQAEQAAPATQPTKVTSSTTATNPGVELSVTTEGDDSKVAVAAPGKELPSGKPKVTTRGYVVDHFERKVVGSNGREPSTGSSYSLSARYRKKNRTNTGKFKVDYTISGHEYAEPFADDYMSQDLKLAYEWRLGNRWRLKNAGTVGMYEYGSEYGFRPEIAYSLNDRSSMSFYGGHRTKVYDSYTIRTDQDRFLGVRYRTKIAGNQGLELSYQRNFNNSEKDRYDYVRSRYSVEYNVPWNRIARTEFRVDYSPRQYESRFIPWEQEPDFGILQHDEGWTFSMTSRLRIDRYFELVPRFMFQNRSSNDPGFEDYSLHVTSIALRGRW